MKLEGVTWMADATCVVDRQNVMLALDVTGQDDVACTNDFDDGPRIGGIGR